MTLAEFAMHRPAASRQLREMLNSVELEGIEPCELEDAIEIYPRYSNGIMFVARANRDDDLLICVGPDHPNAMVEEMAPGCLTWWWAEDIVR